MLTFQDLIQSLNRYWADQGCLLLQPYDMEVGAGTFHPATFLRSLGPEPWKAAYVQPSRRPTDGRYGENPNRLQHYYQYQVMMKPSPDGCAGPCTWKAWRTSASTCWSTISASWRTTGNRRPWAPGASAGRSGWTAWRSPSSPIFSRPAASICKPITAEITYGLERIAMYLQEVDNVYDMAWNREVTYGEIHHRSEFEFSTYNFDQADVEQLRESFQSYEQECHRLVGLKLPLPAYDFCLKCSHAFNILDARGAISVTERTGYIGRVRDMARLVAQAYLALRETMGFPLLA